MTVLDGVTVMIPVTALVLLVAAVINPEWLRRAARFLDDLAEGR